MDGKGNSDKRNSEGAQRQKQPVWAFGYKIAPAFNEEHLRSIQDLLEAERARARRQGRTWEGRFVVEEQVTHILVVTDDPSQDLEANLRLEEALARLKTEYTRFQPLPVEQDPGEQR